MMIAAVCAEVPEMAMTTGDLPAGFRPPATREWRAQMAAHRLRLRLDQHKPGCDDPETCGCVLDAVIAVLDAAGPVTALA